MEKEVQERIDRLKEISNQLESFSSEVFDMANASAGDRFGNAACYLHQASNHIRTAIRGLGGEEIELDLNMIASSLGIDVIQTCRDLIGATGSLQEELERILPDEDSNGMGKQ